MTALVEVLIYAAALDLYRRLNTREVSWQTADRLGVGRSVLSVVDWDARPALLRGSEVVT